VHSRLDEGLRRLNAGRVERPPLSEEEVRRSLLRLARTLPESGAAPNGPLPIDAAGRALDVHRRLYIEAGWLVEEANVLRFHDPRLPALLVGLELAHRGSSHAQMRRMLGGRRHWAEAAWAATAEGDLATDWLRPLFDDGELTQLPDHVVTGCAALAGLRPPRDRTDADFIERAAAAAGTALVWLVPPLDPERPHATTEAWDAWRLERVEWQRAVLDLASRTQARSAVTPLINWKQPEGAVGRLVAALALPPRLSDETAQAVLLLGRPWPRDGASPLDEHFFRLLFSAPHGLAGRVDSLFLETWLVEFGLKALWQGDPRRAARMMVVPDRGHPAGFLLNSGELRSDWCEAWESFAAVEPADEAARAWVCAATWVAKSGAIDDGVVDFLLLHAPAPFAVRRAPARGSPAGSKRRARPPQGGRGWRRGPAPA
jgi:hypothetical protein